ncbi:PVC-type heme-binding CxxCH protein [Algoriphagus vanfongensis]|uniref:PVC-type heme-binding CxxCH protein n=1 Tax=Algoriphagus vanfongensis TaxID=426371 RepID=UPI00040F5EDF|nr:PVC-type heme-binding CxxCH protein [Algoriphagus vanfongensis]
MLVRNLPLFLLLSVFCFFSCSRPSEIPDGFQIEPGFELTRVAAEPLIQDPVDLEFDELGNALVLEMPGYPFEDQQSKIKVLKDLDGDGIYDESQIFVENLQLASSFLPYQKGLLVAAPPYLLFVRDEDQNYIADQVDTLMGGFSTGNLQHNYNGLTLGLDNWIYAANGGNDGAPYWWGDSTSQMDLRGQDFRFNLETKTLERLGESSGGFGLGVDELGRVFETHNLIHISHLVIPDRYVQGKQLYQEYLLENVSDHDEKGLSRIYPIGEQESRVNHPEQSGFFSGSCGITHYGGGALGEKYDHTVWVADVVLNLIHVDHISANGASFEASRDGEKREFLASTDRSFRPVNMAVGPNGAMYVVDMYRKVIEHPEWIPDEIEKTLDLEAGKDQGRIYQIRKEGNKDRFDLKQFQNAEGLIESLSSPNQWVRMTAQRILLESDLTESVISSLRELLNSSNEMAQIHALWILANSGKIQDDEILKALEDSSPDIRETALKIAETRLDGNQELIQKIVELVADSNQRVAMQAGLVLSILSSADFEKDQDLILNQIRRIGIHAKDPWVITALTLATHDASAELLAGLLASSDVKSYSFEFLASLAHASGDQKDADHVLAALVDSPIPLAQKQGLIHAFNAQLKSSSPSLLAAIQTLEKSGNAGIISELAVTRNQLKLAPSAEFLEYSRNALETVMDDDLADSVRLEQMELIELLPYSEKSEVLLTGLNQSQPLKIQEKSLEQLAALKEPAIGYKLVEMWNDLSPQTRRYASDLLLYNSIHHDALLTGLEDASINIGEMNFDLERRRELLWWTDNEETKRRAELLFSDSGVSNRQEAIDQMKPALTLIGNLEAGKVVFERICANCHQFGTIGNEVGPALTEIGRKSKQTLMHDILDPNAAADPEYINHRLETKDGTIHMGIIAHESDDEITIKKMGGESVIIPRSEVESFRSLGSSLMMEGLENSMSRQEMADLLEFLQNGNL